MGLLALGVACGDDDETSDPGEEGEVITTVNVTLTDGTETITAVWADPDGDGGNAPMITDPMPLTLGSTYTMSIEILNETESPADDITLEIQDEAEEHQFFFVTTGDIITVDITDTETDYATNDVGDDLPVGLESEVVATATGTGTLNIVLKHLPPLNGNIQKTGTNTINDGESDFDFNLNITVQE